MLGAAPSVSRPFWRALTLAAAAALIFPGAALVGYRIQSTVQFDFAADPPPGVLTGFYPSERSPDGLTYAWTRKVFGLQLPGLDRRTPWALTVRWRAAGPAGREATVTVALDGVVRDRVPVPADFVERQFPIAPRDGAVTTGVAFSVDPTFVPAGDPRELGVLVNWVRLEPTGPTGPAPTRQLWRDVEPGIVFAGIWAALALPLLAGLGWLTLLAAGTVTVAARGFGPFATLPVWTLVLTALVPALPFGLRRTPARGPALVAALTLAAAYVKLLVLFHPGMPIGDAMFHAHRFQDVLAGHYLFTSITPGNYRFPYSIGLYVFAMPFAHFTRNALQNVALLRLVAVAVDAFAGGLLYWLVRRWRHDEVAGVAAVLAYHLLPVSFGVIATGNLTNVFASSLATMVLVVVGTSPWGRPITAADHPRSVRVTGRAVTASLVGLLACAAFLSHTSTFAVLSTQLALTGLVLLAMRDSEQRRTGVALLLATGAAIGVAVLIYYGHFMDVYREAFSRAAQETGRATAAAGGRTPMARLLDVPRLVGNVYDWPAVVLAAGAVVVVAREHTGWSIAKIALAAWAASCLAFLVLGIVTPVDMRHYLAGVPVVATLVGVGFAYGWHLGGGVRFAVVLLGLWVGWLGVANWLAPLG
jgi:uncharacterized membrane protein